MPMTPIPQRIYDLVKRRPRTCSELIAAIWWIHPQDAPDRSAIKAHVWQANRALRSTGQRITADRGGSHDRGEQPYRVVRC